MAGDGRISPEIWCIQNQQSIGSETSSLNSRSNRTSHPAEPKAETTDNEKKASKKALQKETRSNIQGLHSNATNTEMRKGKISTKIRLTIDAGLNAAIRIKETLEPSEKENKDMPQTRPSSQETAR